MSKPYKTCPVCGSHLDPGERCDCERKKAPARQYVSMYAGAAIKRPAVEATRRP